MALKDYLNIIRKPKKVGRPPKEATRETIPWPNLSLLGQNPSTQAQRVVYKATPRNLRYFSNMPIARRAINAIRNPLTQLDWEIVPNTGVARNSEIDRQIEAVTTCLSLPNDDDSFDSMLTQLIDDICCGAGVMEIGLTGYDDRPVFLWPVDGLSVHIYPGWRGGKNEARYLQTIGYGGSYSVGFTPGIKLRDDEIIYLRPNATTSSPFGFGPMEVAFNSIANQLATAKFAAKLAGNALPPFMLDLGEVSSRVVQTWRSYWTNDIEGEGKIPIIGTELVDGQAGAGKTRGLNVQKLYPEGDKALYLQYQEFLRTEIAAAFDISNMSLNVERDVNRSCYSEDTETLTVDGWRRLDALSAKSLVAVYDPVGGVIEYREPSSFYVAPYTGDMIHISGRMTDSLVTPDHRMWVRPLGEGQSTTLPDRSGFEIVRAEQLEGLTRFATVATFGSVANQYWIIPETHSIPGCTLGGGVLREYPDRSVALDDWLAFLGFWLAEGHAKRYGQGTWRVNLSQNPGPTADWVDSLLSRTPFAWGPNDDDTCRRWQVADKALCQHLISECGDGGVADSHTKRMPAWVFLLPADKMKIVFDAMMSGDGTRDRREDRSSGIYYTASSQLRDDMQLLATFLGHRAVVTMEHVAGTYRVKITDDCPENEIKPSRNVSRVPYRGRVYCFSVPPHCLFVTRRNGKIAVHGNTAEVAEDREWVQAIRPMARLIAGGLTRKVIWGALGFTSIHFGWKGVDREDLDMQSQIHQRYYTMNVYTPNEIRHRLGEGPSTNAWGDMTKSDADIAIQAAKGVGELMDKDLGKLKQVQPPPAVGPAKPHPAGFKLKPGLAASRWTTDEPEDEEDL